MKRSSGILAAMALALTFAGPVMAQNLAPSSSFVRATKMVGTPIYNDHNEKIGQIDDILLPPAGGEISFVVSVGDFVGGSKLVKIPMSHVAMTGGHEVMTGDGSKTAVMAMPNWTWAGGGG